MRPPIALMCMAFAIPCAVVLGGCSEKPHSAGPAGESHPQADADHHSHTAPHGGELIELGEHAASLELVFDSASGTLDLYVLDAHAENYVRIAAPSIPVRATAEGTSGPIAVDLLAVASPLTGETVGDTSRFSAQVPQLQGRPALDIVIPQINVAGMKFADVSATVQSQPQ